MGKQENETKSFLFNVKKWIAATFSSNQKKTLSTKDKVLEKLKEYDSSWKMSLRWLRVIPFIGEWLDDNYGHHHNKRMQHLIKSITQVDESEKNSVLIILTILQTEQNAVARSSNRSVLEMWTECSVYNPKNPNIPFHIAKLPVVNYIGDNKQVQKRSGFYQTIDQAAEIIIQSDKEIEMSLKW